MAPRRRHPLPREYRTWAAPPAPTSCRETPLYSTPPPMRPIRLVRKLRAAGPTMNTYGPSIAGYDIYTAPIGGGEPTLLIGGEGYDAEATVSPQGDKIVFTSTRDGDLDLYTCDIDGSNIKRITRNSGYDGGAFFSPDGQYLVWRASRPEIGRTRRPIRAASPKRAWCSPPKWSCT